ncbi:uncharacterized protein LOC124367735 isoform X2 [Homalodisca vitripennis]|nr:uncharacterized protein LOC124367735 isoform X2 [Homalodisca vitripennis]
MLLIQEVSHDIFRGVNVIGRDEVCDIVIRSGAISSKHAVIEVEDWDTHLVYDCGSTNNTRLGKTILKPNVRYNLQGDDHLTFADLKAVYTKRIFTVQEIEDLNEYLIGVDNPLGDETEDDNLFLLPTQTIKEFKSKQKDKSNKRANLSLTEATFHPALADKHCKSTDTTRTYTTCTVVKNEIVKQCLDNQSKEPSYEDFDNELTQVNTRLLENKTCNISSSGNIYQKSKCVDTPISNEDLENELTQVNTALLENTKRNILCGNKKSITVKHKENLTRNKSVDPQILIINKENIKATTQNVKAAKYSSDSFSNKTHVLKTTTACPENPYLKCKEVSNVVIKEEIDIEMQQISGLNHGTPAISQENSNISENIPVLLSHDIKSECEIKEERVDEEECEENEHTHLATENFNMSCEGDFIREIVPCDRSNKKEKIGELEELNGKKKQLNQVKEAKTNCNKQHSLNVKPLSNDSVEKNSYNEIATKPDYYSKFNLKTAVVIIENICDQFLGFPEKKPISYKIKSLPKVIDPKYSNTKEKSSKYSISEINVLPPLIKNKKQLKSITQVTTNKNVSRQSKKGNTNKTKNSISEKDNRVKKKKVTYKSSDEKNVLLKDGVEPVSKKSESNTIANIIEKNKTKAHLEDSQFHQECCKLSEPSSKITGQPKKSNLADPDVYKNILKENESFSKVTNNINKRKIENDTRDEISKMKSYKLYSHSMEEMYNKTNSEKIKNKVVKDLIDINFRSNCKRTIVKPARFQNNGNVRSEFSSSEEDFGSGMRKRKSVGSESSVVKTKKTTNTDDSPFEISLDNSFSKKSKENVPAKEHGNPDKARSKFGSIKASGKVNCRGISRRKSVSSDTSTSNQPVSKNPRRSFARGEKVLFTGFSNTTYEANVKKLGGTVVDSPDSCTVLVTDKVRRTVKFLCALGQGKPIVDPEWIIQSHRCTCFEDPMNHLLLDVEAQSRFNFDLRQTINEAKKQPMLTSYTVYTTPSVKPPPDDIKSIVESCGGEFLPKVPSKWPDQTIVISHPDDKPLWKNLKVKGSIPPIVAAEFLLLGVLQHRIDTQSHKIS